MTGIVEESGPGGPAGRAWERARALGPGLLVCVLVAVAAQFLSDHYGAPAMLMALLLGMALHFLAEEGRCPAGVAFTSRIVLRVGVALLGARISVGLVAGLGAWVVLELVLAVVLTIGAGVLGARLLGRGWRVGVLTGGAVAICGASAAMALSAAMPRNEHSERNLIFTVLGVTVLSTLAMIAYPVLARVLGLDDVAAGIFLGATIHDVAQVVGAGFSVSDRAGEVATLVKLIRVTMLAPVVLVLTLLVRRRHREGVAPGARPPLVPGFVAGFVALAALNSLGLVPRAAGEAMAVLSRWALLVAIAGVGIKSSLKDMLGVGPQAIVLILAETLFLAGLVLLSLLVLR